MVAAAAVWSYALLDRTPAWHPELRDAVLALAALAVLGLMAPIRSHFSSAVVTGTACLVALLGGSTAFAASTASTPHQGPTPMAGPVSAGGGGGGPGPIAAPSGSRRVVSRSSTAKSRRRRAPGSEAASRGKARQPRSGLGPPVFAGGSPGGPPPGGAPPKNIVPRTVAPDRKIRSGHGSAKSGARAPGNVTSTTYGLLSLLKRARTTWSAATIGSNEAASLEVASDTAVMSIGGFNGSDPAPTLAQFRRYVAEGKIHYFVGGGALGGGPTNQNGDSSISSWVAAHFQAIDAAGQTVYDLTRRVK